MELRHLRYFAAVAEALSFSRAAEKLRVAQPALSRQIRDLEREMGTQLLERGHGRVHLTDAGRVFQAHVLRLLAQVDIAVTAAQEAARGHEGRLVISGDWQFAVGPIPACIRTFREKFPRVEVDLTELPFLDQIEALRAGEAHLCLVPREVIGAREGLEIMTILRSPLVVVTPVNHPLTARRDVRLSELEDESWAWIDSGRARGHRTYMIQQCRLAGFAPKFTKSSPSLDSLLTHVASGGGISLVPDCVLPPGTTQVHAVATDCAPIEICAIWRHDETSRPLLAFVGLLRKHVG
ncbi:MAG: LysR family transcriptional regulator [Opitutaceae bacterium]|nr:LysR family transcriptional regulator [Opitutaceae bacterium]